MFGGSDKSGILGDAYTLDLNTWEWAELPGPPPARSGASAVAIGPKVSFFFLFSGGWGGMEGRR